MQHMHDYLEVRRIPYFIDGGTLLGAQRHNDIIPHDDDIDIGIMQENAAKFLADIEEFRQHYITVGEERIHIDFLIMPNLIKIFFPNQWMKINNKIIGTPTLDVFIWKRKGDMIVLRDKSHRAEFRNCFYKKSEMYPQRLYKLGQIYVYGPRDGIPYLYRYYGTDCLEVIRIDRRDESNPQHKFRGK